MVWAEMVMGRFGYGPIWLWAEMTRDLNNIIFLQIVEEIVNIALDPTYWVRDIAEE